MRLPAHAIYEPDPGEDAPATERLTFQSNREVRHTVVRIITTHLRNDAPVSWQGRNFDFTGVTFDGGDFTSAKFTGAVSFIDAKFTNGTVDFRDAEFADGAVDFSDAEFIRGTVDFSGAEFVGATVSFDFAAFSGATVSFFSAKFADGTVNFNLAEFVGAAVVFSSAVFTGGTVNFNFVKFTDGSFNFNLSKFTGSAVDFSSAEFARAIDFSGVSKWSYPPTFDDPVPSLVKLPAGSDEQPDEGPERV